MLALLIATTLISAPCDLPDVSVGYEREHRIECGWLEVPRSNEDPTPLRLWLAVARASEPEAGQAPIIYINGGPGVATVDSIVPGIHEWKAFEPLRRRRELIFFDQRGSGRSEENFCPALAETLKSVSAAGLSPEEESHKGVAAFAECRQQAEANGFDVGAYTTMANVADIEAIRRAFGADRVKLLSVSYGSMVALQAMRTRPDTIEAAILSSPYPPNSVSWAEQVSSTAASYNAIDGACSRQTDCHGKFGDLLPKLEETLARLEKTPIRHGEKVISGRLFASALWPLAVRSATVQHFPEAVHRAHAGDEAFIRKLVDAFSGGDAFGGFSPAQAYAIMCHESGPTAAWFARARNLYPGIATAQPDDNWDRLCAAYRPGFANAAFFAPVASGIPTLIYAGTFDPATPVVDAYQAMRFLRNATLVEVPGASHAPMSIDDCTLSIGLDFIDVPQSRPDLNCMKTRPPVVFPLEGLDSVLSGGE